MGGRSTAESSGVALSLPTLPRQCRTHAPRSHFPVPERGLACSGGIPSLSSPGSFMLGKVLEPQGDRSLLSPPYRDSPPGPAESGRRNVAAGQAAPRGVSGDAAAAGVELWVRGLGRVARKKNHGMV